MWVLDRTVTKFGARLLKSWVGRPLVDKRYRSLSSSETNNLTLFASSVLQDRVDAVEEIISSSSDKLVVLRQVLKKLPDLAKGLCRIQYGKVCQQTSLS
jgi:DNA mismatch repair protein MSH3